MDASVFTQLIGSLGFPIVMCIYMIYTNNKSHEEHIQQITKLNEQHKQEMSEVTQALNNNTLALQKLTDYLLRGEENVKTV